MKKFETELQELGNRIKKRRNELGYSLRELAELSDLSAAFLSELERGTGNPTLASVRKVVNALQLPLYQLADQTQTTSPVVRKDNRVKLEIPSEVFRIEILTPHLTQKMVLFELVASPETGNLIAQPLANPSEECIVVLSGKLMVRASGVRHELNPGDSIYFEHKNLEEISAIGQDKVHYIAAVT